MSVPGTSRKWPHVRLESAIRGKAENISSQGVFRILTQLRNGPLTQKYLTPFAPAVVFSRMLMGMGSPDNRRKADGSYQTQGVGRGICAPSSARERANDGWASCHSEDRDVLRGCAVGRRRGGLLLRLSR